jgi:hypothetical protein
MQLMLFSNQVSKNDLSHLPKLQSIAPLNEEKIISYEARLRKLHGEFERRFQDFKSIELDLNIFSMSFNMGCEQVKPSLQLELIELQCSTQLKQVFQHLKVGVLQDLAKIELSKFDIRESCPCLFPHICANKFFPA